jgi:hypothetical protein
MEEFIERAKRCDSVYFNPRENEIPMAIRGRAPHSNIGLGRESGNLATEH